MTRPATTHRRRRSMEEGGPSGKKWKPAGVETTDDCDVAALPAVTEAHDPAGVCEEDDDGLVDRISSLPDAVLDDIISLLPTDEGVRTQILASKWRHLWLSAPLNLDCTHLRERYGPERAADIVSDILSSHRGPGRRLCLKGYYFLPNFQVARCYQVATVDAWLQSRALNKLEELEIGYYSMGVPLPSQTFRFAPTLRVATLTGLIACCPISVLADITKHWLPLSWINSLTLRNVGVGVDNYNDGENCVQLKELIIENAPCLKKLLHHHSVTSSLHVYVVSAPQLETIGHLSDGNYVFQRNLDSKLVFGSTIIQGLHVDKLAMLMPCFPCLEKLYIQAMENKSKTNNLWRRKHRDLTRCLDIRLKTIVLDSYRGIKSEVDFVTFFVMNASVLELVKLGCFSGNKEFLAEQRRKLQLDKRASKVAEIHFITRHCVRYFQDVRDLDLVDPFLL
ncbi:hypothetical protein ZWY2020_040526 [Hordeum vulgare]|nr:hypothetical protein ZWY2020_040526 [Hordeum vulgare]